MKYCNSKKLFAKLLIGKATGKMIVKMTHALPPFCDEILTT